jgi:uncharacterized membrane protein YdcZ (DUF606 family)
MNDPSLDLVTDHELGEALRDALPAPFGGVFVNRVLARMRQQRSHSWDEELAAWFWQVLALGSLVVLLAGWGLKALGPGEELDTTANTSIASQLLEGATPGVNVLLASMSSADAP